MSKLREAGISRRETKYSAEKAIYTARAVDEIEKLRRYFECQEDQPTPPFTIDVIREAEDVKWYSLVDMYHAQLRDPSSLISSKVVPGRMRPVVWYISRVDQGLEGTTTVPNEASEGDLKDALAASMRLGEKIIDEFVRQQRATNPEEPIEDIVRRAEIFRRELNLAKIARIAYRIDQVRRKAKSVNNKVSNE